MEKREKTDFILEQVRLCMLKGDYTRAQIISKKINVKFFEHVDNQDLKKRYYDLMIAHALHGEDFYNTCKFYVSIFNTDSIQEDSKKWKEVLQNAVLFVILSPFDNEQSDMIHRLNSQVKLEQLPLYKEFLKCFITNELIKWARLEEIYAHDLKATFVFSSKTEDGIKRYSVLHKRVIEHVSYIVNS